MNRILRFGLLTFPLLAAICALTGCGSRPTDPTTTVAPSPSTSTATQTVEPLVASPVKFTDVSKSAGVNFTHHSGAFGIKLMPETMGSGVAFIDYDGDGYQDLFFVNGRDWTRAEVDQYRKGKWSDDEKTVFKRQHPPGTPLERTVPPLPPHRVITGALYHNNGDGTFSDATKNSGLETEMQGMGAAVGDYDNDGRDDLLVTSLNGSYLFHNEGGGHFREVSQASGVRGDGWGTSAAWVDYDKDGRLDLFVCRYVGWTPETDRYGTMNGREKSYTAPFFYPGQLSRLYRNMGNGKFSDASLKSGVQTVALQRQVKKTTDGEDVPSMSLGVAICDYNNDDWPDILVANDGQPNQLFRNDKNGRFTDIATKTNIALNNAGKTRASMGVDTADIDHSNRDSVVIGNFDNEMIALFYNQGADKGYFQDIAPITAVGKESFKFSVFGCTFLDIDNDGWPDILTASGHIDEQITGIRGTAYALRPLLFWNQGKGRYEEIATQTGTALQQPIVGRGLAYADFDLDGDVDVVMTTNNGPALLLRNDGNHSNHALRLVLKGQ